MIPEKPILRAAREDFEAVARDYHIERATVVEDLAGRVSRRLLELGRTYVRAAGSPESADAIKTILLKTFLRHVIDPDDADRFVTQWRARGSATSFEKTPDQHIAAVLAAWTAMIHDKVYEQL